MKYKHNSLFYLLVLRVALVASGEFLSAMLIGLVALLPVIAADASAQAESTPYEQLKTYDFGQNAAPLAAIENEVRQTAVGDYGAIEEKLISVVTAPDATLAARQFACRMLRRIGTENCVPALQPLLLDKELSHMARYALEAMPGAQVDQALLEAVRSATDETRIGIINSLGERRSREALQVLPGLLLEDNATAAAALTAIGKIGDRTAAKLLLEFESSEALVSALSDARVTCADRLLEAGDKKRAALLYRDILAGSDTPTRIAALRGILAIERKKAAPLLLDVLKDDDVMLRQAAASAVAGAPAKVVVKLAGNLPSLDPRTQVVLIGALAERGEEDVSDDIVAMVSSEDADVSEAAVRALAQIGDLATAGVLVEVAAASGSSSAAAFESLVQMRSDGIDALLLERAAAEDPSVRKAVMRVLVERRVVEVMPQLLAALNDADKGVRREALKGLSELAGVDEFTQLVKMLVDSQGDAAIEKCVASVYVRLGSGQATYLIQAMDGADDNLQASLLRVLGRVGGQEALSQARRRLAAEDGGIRESALRVLCAWPDPAPAQDLLQIAGETENTTYHVLALRSCIDMAGRKKDTPLLVSTLKIARRPEEKKQALSALARVGNAEAMETVMLYAADETLFREAALSAATLAESMTATRPTEAREWLERLLLVVERQPAAESDGQDAVWRKRIEDVLSKTPIVVNVWMLAGPYSEAGKGAKDLMGTVFPPEPGQAADVVEADWKRIDAPDGIVDLLKQAGGAGNTAAYLRTTLRVPEEQDILFELGSDDGIKVWLNDTVVHENNAMRGLAIGQDKVKVHLQQGDNLLLMKITQGGGGWAASARIVGADGNSLRGLKIHAE